MELFPFDAEYLRRLIAGEPPVVKHFVEYITKLLTPMLRNRGAKRAAIEDIIQDTFRRLWEKLRTPGYIRRPESLGALVCSICKNVLMERYRDQNRFQQLDPDYDMPIENDPYLALVSDETCAKVQATLHKLSPRDEKILNAVWIEGRPRREVCDEMNVDPDYLRVLIHRANEEFRKKYDDDEDPDHDA